MLITNPDVSRKKDVSLSLILTTYNRLDVLQRFIESLLKHKIVNTYEVILLNQGTPNPNIKLIFEPSCPFVNDNNNFP
jgi:GT2 family glycosyltransferase